MTWSTAWDKAVVQVETCKKLVKTYVDPWYGASEYEFPTPIPPPVGMLYTAHESATKWRYQGKLIFAPARYILTNYPEASLKNLTCKIGDDEVKRLNVDPYDVRSHHWAAQAAFWESRDRIDAALLKYGFAPFDSLDARQQTVLLLLPRAVGVGCTRGLLWKAGGAKFRTGKYMPVDSIMTYLKWPLADTSSFDGAQGTETVRLRFSWCYLIVFEHDMLPGYSWPVQLSPPKARPSNLVPMPADFKVAMQAYSAKAKKEGPKPTGPWPF